MTAPPRPGPGLRIRLPQVAPSLREFLATEAGGAMLLLIATVVALGWANSPWSGGYARLWETTAEVRIGGAGIDMSLLHWVNDGAMAVFFTVVGLEISREFTAGELRDRRMVAVPALGAIGGLALPATIYLLANTSGPAARGWGVPMSTDTAFVVGILALFGPRCPDRLRLFLLTLAIVDDIGAICVVGVFYTERVDPLGLLVAGGVILAILALRWLGVWQLPPYVLLSLVLWGAVHASGVHATLAGVLTGLLTPARPPRHDQIDEVPVYVRALAEDSNATRAGLAVAAAKATVSPNERLQRVLHPFSAFIVVPVFGLANAGVHLDAATLRAAAASPVTLGIMVALVAGNAVGITLASTVAIRSGLGQLPGQVRYSHLMGAATLAGIGFTISLFITELAFTDPELREQAKIGILGGSLTAAVAGTVILRVLGERMPLCSPLTDEPVPRLPPRPWRAPAPVK
ncbi:Na(+)/H(+) antiporter NhaA 3 [Frankia canadensis]|uniref:Na(+)/H(+) antiporter NhaA n=1 Tax=Frankia canadensis TaxID=1836972 RepID=A0A2I2KR07_9ACTN|nr:Na+/H+ antiporter NhaA [Frankia canadensis]SNQ48076.1 Na(+)/H(+) antiporter NhaA 3 [Frankia canadensis]SOU55366.1 Na(+)/H(+) antiporter NhaA 3 [Frankia canadensis]